jgi:hypothetical protein
MKEGYVCLRFQSINVIMNDSNQLNKFWMVSSSINQKGTHDYLNIPKIAYFHLECQNLIKKNQIMSFFFAPMSPILLSKILE